MHVLLIEDNEDHALLIRKTLANQTKGVLCQLECVDRLSAGLARLAQGGIDAVLLDLSLPDSQGLDTLVKANTQAPGVPFVVLTALNDETLGVKAVQMGAQDYLVKGGSSGELLVRALRYAIERHRMKTELEQTRKKQLEMKDRFLSHISHELRSPLTAIYQFVTIVLDGLAGDINPEQREYLEITLRNINQLRTMIGDLLEVTRAETGKLAIVPQRISLGELIADTLKTLQASAKAKGVRLLAGVPGDLPGAYADPDRIRQVLVNLIDNAIKFTPEHGRIFVEAQVSDADPNYACVAVSDTGCGISPEGCQMVFERLYQEPNPTETSRKGLGLGLYICRDLISRHGGRIWVESQLGRGSTFFFTVPLAARSGVSGEVHHEGRSPLAAAQQAVSVTSKRGRHQDARPNGGGAIRKE
jgi:signal transduction histidine kinase